MEDRERKLLDLYVRRMDDGSRRYIIFDHESWIPYFYDSDRSSVLRLYMEPDESCVITSGTIDRYTSKNSYEKILSLGLNQYLASFITEHCEINDKIQFKSDMRKVLTYLSFNNYNKNIINMAHKLERVITFIK